MTAPKEFTTLHSAGIGNTAGKTPCSLTGNRTATRWDTSVRMAPRCLAASTKSHTAPHTSR